MEAAALCCESATIPLTRQQVFQQLLNLLRCGINCLDAEPSPVGGAGAILEEDSEMMKLSTMVSRASGVVALGAVAVLMAVTSLSAAGAI